jgi:acyl transferase domain-containing protein
VGSARTWRRRHHRRPEGQDADAVYDPDPDAGASLLPQGGFVNPIDLFDAPFAGVTSGRARWIRRSG